jgi:hypothetical protein
MYRFRAGALKRAVHVLGKSSTAPNKPLSYYT